MTDRTTLKIALETDAWMAVYCAEPERLIDVQMRYKDLVAIRKLIVRYCEEQARMDVERKEETPTMEEFMQGQDLGDPEDGRL